MTSCQHMAAGTYYLHIPGKQASESSKILVPIYQTTRCHISEYHNVKQTYPYSLYYIYALSTVNMARNHSLNCLVGCYMV